MLSDNILQYFPAGYKGTVIEIGAGFPKMGNPVFGLRQKGWDIISVEPNPSFCKEYESLGYSVLQYACYSEVKGEMPFEITPNGLSGSSLVVNEKHNVVNKVLDNGFNEFTGKQNGLSEDFDWSFFPCNGKTKIITVEALTLATILKRHMPLLKKADVIIIDVENFELDVLKGVDFDAMDVTVFIIENIPSDPSHYEFMNSKGYMVNERIDINDFYVKKCVD